MHALDVFPPEVDGNQNGEAGRKPVGRDLQIRMCHAADFVHETGKILAGADDTDRSRQDVIEQQRVAHHDVNAAAHEHGGTLHINRAHGETEQHDAENKPSCAAADRLFGDTAGVKRRRGEVAENDRSSSPERDKSECDRGCDNDFCARPADRLR